MFDRREKGESEHEISHKKSLEVLNMLRIMTSLNCDFKIRVSVFDWLERLEVIDQ